jgi:transcriptional regulator with XRE-family HTH domain
VVTSEDIRLLRRELGKELAGWRQAVGFTQAQLGRKVGYSRSTVSTVESGGQQVPREFWVSCDELLGTAGRLTELSGAIKLEQVAEGRTAAQSGSWPELPKPRRAASPGRPHTAAEYASLGWPVEQQSGQLELVTGSAVDALELSRPAGMLAAHWWLGTGGNPDTIRGLPALPPPAMSLAVIAAGPRFFFLVQSGACPWLGSERVPASSVDASAAVIRWHAEGSRIPAPPGDADTLATWLYPPGETFRLADPIALLDLLAKAAAAVRRHPAALVLPDGIIAVPAWSQ